MYFVYWYNVNKLVQQPVAPLMPRLRCLRIFKFELYSVLRNYCGILFSSSKKAGCKGSMAISACTSVIRKSCLEWFASSFTSLCHKTRLLSSHKNFSNSDSKLVSLHLMQRQKKNSFIEFFFYCCVRVCLIVKWRLSAHCITNLFLTHKTFIYKAKEPI